MEKALKTITISFLALSLVTSVVQLVLSTEITDLSKQVFLLQKEVDCLQAAYDYQNAQQYLVYSPEYMENLNEDYQNKCNVD